jgi:hypothetical protein
MPCSWAQCQSASLKFTKPSISKSSLKYLLSLKLYFIVAAQLKISFIFIIGPSSRMDHPILNEIDCTNASYNFSYFSYRYVYKCFKF